MSQPPAGRTARGVEGRLGNRDQKRGNQKRVVLLPDRDDLRSLWQSLVENHGVTGFRAHDVRLVAAMQS